jgi:hypothetical protein
VFFPYIFRTFHIYPHLGSTTFSTRRRLRWPMRQAHACGPKASHGRGNLRSWHRYTGTSSRLGRGRLLAIFFLAEFAESSESYLMSAVANECVVLKAYICLKSKATSLCNSLCK